MKAIATFLVIFVCADIVDSMEKNLGSISRMTRQLVEENGYPFESHWVRTTDNYILNIHRIPPGITDKNNKRVVFLQHGILSLSTAWILLGQGKSLAFMLADDGYDVWMGNFRGNIFSRNHTILNPDTDTQFWQFTWNEMGLIDLPTMIDYVLSYTRVDKLHFVGHSQGSTAFYVMTSEKAEYNDKVTVEISLAPIAFLDHLTSPILRMMSRFGGTIKLLMDMTGIGEFLPETGIVGNMINRFCKRDTIKICDNIMFSILGSTPDEIEDNTTALMIQCHPAGASTMQMMHFVQEIKSGYFRKYDYGSYKNLEIYGTPTPPEYQLEKITTPIYLIYSNNDLISATADVDKLYLKLKNCRDKFMISNFGHLDYMFGRDAPDLVNKRILNIFNRY